MARIRTIKPGFFRSPDMAALPFSTRLTYIGLWTYVDDEGKGVDDARLVKGDLWQLDDKHTLKRVEADLELLADRGHIERYQVNDRRYLRVVAWKDHQRINRPTPSTLPDPSWRIHGGLTEGSRQEGKGMEKEGSADAEAPYEPSAGPPSEVVRDAIARAANAVRLVS